MAATAKHVTIIGRVQGVGYRQWVGRQAAARGLAGWVRNRNDGSVEAVFAADAESVDAMVAACHIGPPAALVAEVRVESYTGPPLTRFAILPTA